MNELFVVVAPMAVPKKKISPSRAGKRRSGASVRCESAGECSRCGEMKLSHTACPSCGFYRNMRILPVEV